MIGSFKNTNSLYANQFINPWVRPADWLAMPTIGSQEVIALFAISDDDANFIAVNCQGNYTVDWGDGNVNNYVSNTVASKSYVFSAITGSTTTTGYKQVLIRITPQAGQNLTSVSFVNHPTPNKSITCNVLDIDINGPFITTLNISNNPIGPRLKQCERVKIRALSPTITSLLNLFIAMSSLKSVDITYSATTSVANFTSMFNGCVALEEPPFFDTSNATNTTSMFQGCSNLKKVPLYDTGKVVIFTQMFLNCFALQSVPFFDTKLGQIFTSMFNNSGVLTIPPFNMSAATTTNQMFLGNIALITIPDLNMVNNLSTSNMFNGCRSLVNIGNLITTKCTDFSFMFGGCTSLLTIPLFDTSKGTTFANMFNGCSSLTSIPLINTISGTTFQAMLFSCSSLQEVPLLDTGNGITFTNMLSGCGALEFIPTFNTSKGTTFQTMCSTTQFKVLPALNFSAATNMTQIFLNNTSISRSLITGTRFTISYSNAALSQAAIVEIFTNLGTASGAQTITVSTNFGYAGLTAAERLIATSKGWTIA